MDSSLFHPYDKPKFKAHVSKIDTVKSPNGKLAHDIIYPQTSLKLPYVTFEICILCRRNVFFSIFTPKKLPFNLRPPIFLSTCICVAGAVFCDGCKNIIFIFAGTHAGLSRFWCDVLCFFDVLGRGSGGWGGWDGWGGGWGDEVGRS